MESTASGLGLAQAKAHLCTQPFSVLLGARLTRFDADGACLEIDARTELLQQNGFLHGGVLAYAADNAVTYAAGTVLGAAVLTGGISIEYLRPAHGTTLRATARVIHAGRARVLCACDLWMIDEDGNSRLCAIATGTVYPVSDPAGKTG